MAGHVIVLSYVTGEHVIVSTHEYGEAGFEAWYVLLSLPGVVVLFLRVVCTLSLPRVSFRFPKAVRGEKVFEVSL